MCGTFGSGKLRPDIDLFRFNSSSQLSLHSTDRNWCNSPGKGEMYASNSHGPPRADFRPVAWPPSVLLSSWCLTARGLNRSHPIGRGSDSGHLTGIKPPLRGPSIIKGLPPSRIRSIQIQLIALRGFYLSKSGKRIGDTVFKASNSHHTGQSAMLGSALGLNHHFEALSFVPSAKAEPD